MKRVVRSLKRRRTIGARLEILLRQQRRRFLNSSTIFLLSNLLQVRRTNSITNNFYASISIFILRKILSAPKIVIILPRRNRNRSSISIVSHEWNTKFYPIVFWNSKIVEIQSEWKHEKARNRNRFSKCRSTFVRLAVSPPVYYSLSLLRRDIIQSGA